MEEEGEASWDKGGLLTVTVTCKNKERRIGIGRGVEASGLHPLVVCRYPLRMQWISLLRVPLFPMRFAAGLYHATSNSDTGIYCRMHAPCGVRGPSTCVGSMWHYGVSGL